jgi:putative hydrolase of the HAD superfamily
MRDKLTVARVEKLWEAFLASHVPDPWLLTVLQPFRPAKRIVILSNYWDLGRKVIERFVPTDLYDRVILSADAGFMKPSREIFEVVAHSEGVSLADMVLVDDEAENIRAARKLGVSAFLYPSEVEDPPR